MSSNSLPISQTSKKQISQIRFKSEKPKAKYKKNIKTNGRFRTLRIGKQRRKHPVSGRNGREYAARGRTYF